MAKYLSMAGSGLTRLSEALTPVGTQTDDEDIIKKQIESEITFQAEESNSASKKIRKRKSRDGDGFDCNDSGDSPGKKKTERKKMKREQKRLSKLKNGRITSSEFSANDRDRLEGLTNDASHPVTRPSKVPVSYLSKLNVVENRADGEQTEVRGDDQRYSNVAVAPGHTSLGSNKEALLQSILKGCAPEKSSITKTEHKFPSGSENGEDPVVPAVVITLETPSKEKRRRKVSMVPILPEGYKPDHLGRFHCPVEGCDKVYSRRSTLGEHMNTLHAGEILNDNLDGSMTIISADDYERAISSGNGQTIVEIPSVPPLRKSRKVRQSKVNENRDLKALSTVDSLQQDPEDGGAAYVIRSNGAKASNPRHKLPDIERSTIVALTTPSKLNQSERNSSEYETSSGNESSDIEGRPKPSKSSTIGLSMTRNHQPSGSTGSFIRASTVAKLVTPSKSGATLSSGSKIAQREISKDGMEDWEIEPGVIVGSDSESSSDSETEHNTAYSSVYIASAEAGVKLPGVHFQVIRIAPGSTAPGPNVPYLRVCSVAAGKVLVSVGENSFSIGANGMWRIKAGEQCTVRNRHYSEAVIHVSTVKSD